MTEAIVLHSQVRTALMPALLQAVTDEGTANPTLGQPAENNVLIPFSTRGSDQTCRHNHSRQKCAVSAPAATISSSVGARSRTSSSMWFRRLRERPTCPRMTPSGDRQQSAEIYATPSSSRQRPTCGYWSSGSDSRGCLRYNHRRT
jgi:hypothetical protein